MPKTKQSKRTSPTGQLSAEDLKEVETILQDFDQQCDKFVADVEKDNATFMDSLVNYAKLELFKWPKTARKKKLGDIFPSADSELWKNYDELEAAALAGKSDPSSSTTASLASSSVDNNALKDALEEVAESVASQVKRGLKSTRKRGAAAVARTKAPLQTQTPSVTMATNGVAMPPPSTGVRRSTRKRAATETPMMNAMPSTSTGSRTRGATASIVKGSSFETPSIRAATRSDMMTPLNRSVARIAKPGENLFLVSENSSPIVGGTYTATKGRAKKPIKPAKVAAEEVKIPLGGGRTLMLPVDATAEEGGLNDLDLDDDAREKVLKIKSMLDKIKV